jgi:coenzyme F420 biosynthesis associated uncharacterized protein
MTATDGSAPGSGTGRATADGSVVDWQLAERVARWTANRKPLPPRYRADVMQRDFDQLTERAETLVGVATGLQSLAGPAHARVTGRDDWAAANVASMRRLLGPSLQKLAGRRQSARPGPGATWLPRPLADAGRSASGAQLGLVLAYMSTRVLGQYDLLLTDETAVEQDIVYYVGPNVVELEQRHGFEPQEFRLWLALHEVTHRCQFTGVPWLRDHFVGLVDRALEAVTADPRRVLDAIRRAAESIRSGKSALDDAGLVGLVATPEQLEALREIQALMSLLEGHGDIVMDRAGASAVHGAARFARVLRDRREQAKGPAKLLQRLLGLEAKFRQYAEGERFVAAVEAAGGTELFDRVWRGPQWLPSLEEIRSPAAWIARVGPAPALAG